MLLFGFGDGGGGPDVAMIERLRRESDVDGLPKVSIQNPTDFFHSVVKNDTDLPVWVGELVRTFLFVYLTLSAYLGALTFTPNNRSISSFIEEHTPRMRAISSEIDEVSFGCNNANLFVSWQRHSPWLSTLQLSLSEFGKWSFCTVAEDEMQVF
jgi:hypothetical protein